MTVLTMSTRLSGSSTQSTGTSWMRSPCRSVSSSSSVSKNHSSSSTAGSSAWAISVRTALNPHWASEKPGSPAGAQPAPPAAGEPGRRSRATAPPPSAFSSATSPPASRTACATIASPRPEPGMLRAEGERQNRSKT